MTSLGEFLFGRFKTLDLLGEGSTGRIYRVLDTVSERPVALKILHPGVTARIGKGRFSRQFYLVAQLKHPRIVPMIELGESGGTVWFTTELLEGRPLSEIEIPVPPARTAGMMLQIAEGLEFIHGHGILHLDLKPANIFLTEDGLRLLDFGLAGENETAICGTPAYMAPETASGGYIDGRSDLYALGVIGLETLVGKNCFDRKTAAKSIEAQLGLTPEVPHLSKKFEPLARLIGQLLAKDPADRPPGAYSVRLALQDLLGQERTPGTGYFLPEGPFVGREAETESVVSAWRAIDGPVAISVEGESGSGLTAFCDNLVLRTESEGGRIATVTGRLSPIVEMLTPYRSGDFVSQLKRYLPGLLPVIGGQLKRDFLQSLDIKPSLPPENSAELSARVVDLFEALTETAPLMAHICRVENEPLWNALANSKARIMMLFDRGGPGETVRIEPLSQGETGEYIRGIFGRVDGEEQLIKRTHGSSGGKPDRLRETLREFVLNSALFPGTERWEFRPELVPDETPFDDRMERLSEIARYMAISIAVSGDLPADLAESLIEGDYFYASYSLLAAGLIIERETGERLDYLPSRALSKWVGNNLPAKTLERFHRDLASVFLVAEPGPERLATGALHLENAGDGRLAFKTYFEAGTGFMRLGRYERAEPSFVSAVGLADFSDDPETTIKAFKRLALSRKYLGDFEGAREMYYRALAAARAGGLDDQVASTLGDIGVTFFESGNIPKAIELYGQARTAHKKAGSEKGYLIDTANLAGAYQVAGRLDEARAEYEHGSEIAEKLDHDLTKCAITLNLGELDLREGNLTGALTKALSAAALARKKGFEQILFEALLVLAEVHRRQGRPPLSKRALAEAEELAGAIGARAGAKIAMERAALARVMGLQNDAIAAIAEAHSMRRHLGESEITEMLNEIALSTAAGNDLSLFRDGLEHTDAGKSAKTMLNGFDALEKGEDDEFVAAMEDVVAGAGKQRECLAAGASVALARFYFERGNKDAAVDALDRGETFLISGDPYPRSRIDALRAQIYASSGEISAARRALSQTRSALRSIGNKTALSDLAPLERSISAVGEAPGGLEQLLPIIKALNSTLETGKLLRKIVDVTIAAIGAERGLLFVSEHGGIELVIAVGADGKELPIDGISYSHGLVDSVLASGRASFSGDVASDEGLSSRASVIDLELTMALCAPILGPAGDVRGLVYADSRIGRGRFDESTLQLISALTDQASVALMNAERFDVLRAERDRMARELAGRFGGESIIGESPAIEELRRRLSALAPRDISVLITGETGTGKDLFARAIHSESPRKEAPFVAINCAALPENLLESELFGHEKGAFTGAVRRHIGRFERADGGVLFLDEIGEMPVRLQAKLLRVLENQRFMRLGGSEEIAVDVRLITATNRDPERAIAEKTLREDLYYRIAPVRVHIPPLRERRSDIPALTAHFIAVAAEKFGRRVDSISREALATLEKYRWPGNVRELSSAIEETVLFAPGRTIRRGDIPQRIIAALEVAVLDEAIPPDYEGLKALKKEYAEMIEDRVIRGLLEEYEWNIAAAARAYGINRSRLHQLVVKYGLEKTDRQ